MSTKKEELHKLIEKLPIRVQKTAYDFLINLIERKGKHFVIEADVEPISVEEMVELEIAQRQIENGEVVDWEDIKNALR